MKKVGAATAAKGNKMFSNLEIQEENDGIIAKNARTYWYDASDINYFLQAKCKNVAGLIYHVSEPASQNAEQLLQRVAQALETLRAKPKLMASVIPINIGHSAAGVHNGMHWTALVLRRNDQDNDTIDALYNDSMGTPMGVLLPDLNQILLNQIPNARIIDFTQEQQTNQHDCGAWASLNMDSLARTGQLPEANEAYVIAQRKELFGYVPAPNELENAIGLMGKLAVVGYASPLSASSPPNELENAIGPMGKSSLDGMRSPSREDSTLEVKEDNSPVSPLSSSSYRTIPICKDVDSEVQKMLAEVKTEVVRPQHIDEISRKENRSFYKADHDLQKLKIAHDIIFKSSKGDIPLINDALDIVRKLINKSMGVIERFAGGSEIAQMQDYIFCTGQTQVGKSTFISRMQGDRIWVHRHDGEYVLDNAKKPGNILIGHGIDSATIDVNVVDVPGLGIFIDWPGSGDTGGWFTRLKNFVVQQDIFESVG